MIRRRIPKRAYHENYRDAIRDARTALRKREAELKQAKAIVEHETAEISVLNRVIAKLESLIKRQS